MINDTMNFSKEWESVYQNNLQMSLWPWSDLVSYIMRYARPTGLDFKVLELGCGAGANIPFFKTLNVKYFAIEGSKTIVEKLYEKYPEYKRTICVGDFTKEISFEEQFDLIIDRASLTHNTSEAITSTLVLVDKKLKTGGKYIGIDWFSTAHTEYSNSGEQAEDVYTRKNLSGPFKGVGRVHFSDKQHIEQLFLNFKIKMMEHKITKQEIPDTQYVLASWNFFATKK